MYQKFHGIFKWFKLVLRLLLTLLFATGFRYMSLGSVFQQTNVDYVTIDNSILLQPNATPTATPTFEPTDEPTATVTLTATLTNTACSGRCHETATFEPSETVTPTTTACSRSVRCHDATPTEIPSTGVELVVNGSFETAVDKLPLDWTGKNLTGDKQKCNKQGKPPIAQEGVCAFVFKGVVDKNSKLSQSINLTAILPVEANVGDILTLSGFVNVKGEANAKAKVRVKYTDTTLPKGKITVNITSATGGYVTFASLSPELTLVLADVPQNLKVQLQSRSLSGKVFFDSIGLELNDSLPDTMIAPPRSTKR